MAQRRNEARLAALACVLLFAAAGVVGASTSEEDSCSCASELKFVVDYCETNLPAYIDNVTDETRAEYESLKRTLHSEALKTTGTAGCYKLLNYFVEYFRDNHSRISMNLPRVDESDSEALQAFLASETFLGRERLDLPDPAPGDPGIEEVLGTYETSDGTYRIQIVEAKTPLRDYAGIIVASKTPLWVEGQVKLELKRKADGGLEAFSYLRNHSLKYSPDFPLESGMLGKTWFKTSLPTRKHHGVGPGNKTEYRSIDDQTAYLRIPSFSGGRTAEIEALYKAAAKTIRSHSRLIIDVRDNGGGSDANVDPLLDYLYTGPIQGDKVDLYVTADNIKMWERWYEKAKKDKKNYDRASRKWFKNEIRKMKAAEPGTFIVRSPGRLYEQEVPVGKPDHIAVLFNRRCASSCETLLFWAQQSDKAVLVGENSGGYVGYGEVGGVETPCMQFDLHTSMTRYQEHRKYEVIGIAPDHRLDPTSNWIEQTLAILNEMED